MFDARKAMELQKLHGVENFKKLTIPQMLERGKLIELLREVQYLGGLEEKIADRLIANDVVPVVRCKDCKYLAEAFDGSSCCKRLWRTAIPYVREDDFCSYGERKDNDRERKV